MTVQGQMCLGKKDEQNEKDLSWAGEVWDYVSGC